MTTTYDIIARNNARNMAAICDAASNIPCDCRGVDLDEPVLSYDEEWETLSEGLKARIRKRFVEDYTEALELLTEGDSTMCRNLPELWIAHRNWAIDNRNKI